LRLAVALRQGTGPAIRVVLFHETPDAGSEFPASRAQEPCSNVHPNCTTTRITSRTYEEEHW
jgi:hypothetical protein